jgi:DNA-binding transcriptional MerR regulator
MFRIGEFSKMSLISVRMLRHYDELGLLKPARVDEFTGYRYYSAGQLARLNRLRALRDMGLSLEQIGYLLDNDISAEQIKGMLRLKEAELERTLNEGQTQLAKVKSWLAQLEGGNQMVNQVQLRSVAPVRVAAVREVTEGYTGIEKLCVELEDYLKQHNVKPVDQLIVLYHEMTSSADNKVEYNEGDVDQEACLPIADDLPENDRIKVRVLPAIETAATIVHVGPWDGLAGVYEALGTWVETNGYNVVGPIRDRVINAEPIDDPSRYSCEIIFPVSK